MDEPVARRPRAAGNGVEVAPADDHPEITSVAASHTAYELTITARQIAASG